MRDFNAQRHRDLNQSNQKHEPVPDDEGGDQGDNKRRVILNPPEGVPFKILGRGTGSRRL